MGNFVLGSGKFRLTTNDCYRYKGISSLRPKHVVGQGGRTLSKLESFVGLFAFVKDTRADPEMCFVGWPRTLLAC